MDKAKRILALLAVILLGGMYVAALIFSLMSSDRAQVCFRAALAGTVLIPVLLYLFLLVLRAVRPAKSAVVDAIVFDVGNVLLKWDWQEYLLSIGISEEAVRAFKEKVVGTKAWDALDDGKRTREDVTEDLVQMVPEYAEEFRTFMRTFADGVEPFPYTEGWLRALREKGYRLYFLSNWNRECCEELKARGVMDFEKQMDGGLWSYTCGLVKPDPAIYRKLLADMRLDPKRTVFIDDNEKNVKGARDAGMSGILFKDYGDAAEKLRSIGVVW